MSRIVPAAIVTAHAQANVQPFYAVELGFDTDTLRFWTGPWTRAIGGQDFLGAGNLLTVSGLEEAADLTAVAVTLTLSGIPRAIVSLALQEPYQNRPCKIFYGCRDVTEVVEVFSGRMNTMTLEDQGETSTIQLTVDSKLVLLESTNTRRFTSENHQSRYPGDLFFSYVADLQDRDFVWGRAG